MIGISNVKLLAACLLLFCNDSLHMHCERKSCIHCVHWILRWWGNTSFLSIVLYHYAFKKWAAAFKSRPLIEFVLLFTHQLRNSCSFFSFRLTLWIRFSKSGVKCSTGVKCPRKTCLRGEMPWHPKKGSPRIIKVLRAVSTLAVRQLTYFSSCNFH